MASSMESSTESTNSDYTTLPKNVLLSAEDLEQKESEKFGQMHSLLPP